MKESKLRNEIGIFFGIIVLIPVAMVQVWFEKLFGKKLKLTKQKVKKKQFETLKVN